MAKRKTPAATGTLPAWLVNGALLVALLLVLLLGYSFVAQRVGPDPHREANPGGFVGEILQVEVVNGSGVSGLAASTTQYLRRRGFDVVAVGNYTRSDEPRSLVLDRVGDPDAALKIAAALGIDAEQVREDLEPSYYLDATVVIGLDYADLAPFADLGD